MMGRLFGQIGVYRDILRHPLNKGRPWAATKRWLSWHVGSRLVPGPVAIPFVDETMLLIEPGMTGASQNLYCGLTEPADMGFLLHSLRSDDLFLDVGANVGAYSVLAAGAAGARAIAIEPYPPTAGKLRRNVQLNGLTERVEIFEVATGDRDDVISFTTGEGPMNHVAAAGETGILCQVPVRRLDDLLAGRAPTLLKMDVEGYELPALHGAPRLLAEPALQAIIIELNGSGARYGWADQDVVALIVGQGFRPARYDPMTRQLREEAEPLRGGNNVLYLRNPAAMQKRVQAARRFRLNNGLWL
jgi:FkbM family methyltransferase